MGRIRTAPAALALVIVVGLGASACSADDDSDSASVEPAEIIADDAEMSAGDSDTAGGGEATDAAAPGATTPAGALALDGRALATTAGVRVTAPDIRQAVDDTLTTVARNNATVFNADVNIGSERDDGSIDGSGWFVVKVSPVDLETLIADLGATVGTVSGRTQETSDVTDQLVDLEIRIGVERDVIDRFRLLLDEATAFQDIVDIERVIAERTIALEQLLASQRNLENRVELSTLTIELQYAPPGAEVVDETTEDTIGDAWRAGWDAFAGVFFALGFALAVAAPFLVTAAIVGVLVWAALRRRPQRRTGERVPSPGAEAVSEADEFAAPSRER
jgi:hypothetical protein